MPIKKRLDNRKTKIIEHLDKVILYLKETKTGINDGTLTEKQYKPLNSAAKIIDTLIWEHLAAKNKKS
jgi:hypothetical protein